MFCDLYEKISQACCYITVFLDDEKISEGTGFSFSKTGDVLTAAHVVTGRWPIMQEDYRSSGLRIFCKFPGIPLIEYKVAFCAITLQVPGFSEPIQLDLAALVAQTKSSIAFPFLRTLVHPPKLGQRVLLAGYSDELELPFDFKKLLEPKMPGVSTFLDAMDKGYMADMTGPLIKQGYVGNLRRIAAENSSAAERIECEIMYIDNSMHSGASGGPVVNVNGDVVAMITKRSITSVSQSRYPGLDVPSGCTVALGLQPLVYIAQKTGGA